MRGKMEVLKSIKSGEHSIELRSQLLGFCPDFHYYIFVDGKKRCCLLYSVVDLESAKIDGNVLEFTFTFVHERVRLVRKTFKHSLEKETTEYWGEY